MPALVAGIHVLLLETKTRMAGASGALFSSYWIAIDVIR